jgi:hypothetical protein
LINCEIMIFCSIYGVHCETIEISCTFYELNAWVQWDVAFFIIEQLDSLQVFVLGSKCQDHLFSWSTMYTVDGAEYHDLTIYTLSRTGDAYGLTTYTVDGTCRIFQCFHNLYRSWKWCSLFHNLYRKWRRFLWSKFLFIIGDRFCMFMHKIW